MATEFKLPELGENIEAGDLVRLMITPGSQISEGQPVMELETDKAVIEVPSSVSGTVQDIRVKAGDKIKVGQVIFTIDGGGGAATEAKAAAPQEKQPQATPKEKQPAGEKQATGEAQAEEEAGASESGAKAEMQTLIRAEGKTQQEALPPDQPQKQAPAKPAATPSTAGATEFKLPELGENIEQGDLVRLMISPGADVNEGDPVMELETDKAVVEVPSSVSGKVKEVRVNQGDKVKVGQVIFTVEASGAPSQAQPAQPKPEQAEAAPPRREERPAAQAEAAPSKPAQPAQISQNEDEERMSGQHGARAAFQAAIRAEGKTERAALPPDRRPQSPPSFELPAQLVKTAGPEHHGPIPAAPHIRRLARELGVDIYQVKGSGPGGRISEDDVKAFAKSIIITIPDVVAAAGPAHIAAPELPDFSKWGKIERVSMRGIRRKTAQHLWEAWHTVAHVTQHDQADISELEKLRSRFSTRSEQGGGPKITITAIALKVCASALKVFPQFNASVDMGKEEVVYKQYINIGVAVDTDRGLLVPVIRDVDRKNISELAQEMAELSRKARDKKLSPEQMEGGTFTITNLGGIGGTSFTPIVNHPEVAILGMSRSRTEPCWTKDRFEPRLMLPLSLSYDHRLIDGADAARFLRWVVEALEQPFLLSVQG